jgi:hypothetical protein
MILRPWWTQRRAWPAEHLVGARAQDLRRVGLDALGVVEMNIPPERATRLGEHLAVHDGVGAALVGRATLNGDRLGKVGRPRPNRYRDDRLRKRGGKLVERGRCCAYDRRSHFIHQFLQRIVVEGLCRTVHEVRPADVMDRGRGQVGVEQLDPSTVDHLVICGSGHDDGPAEVVSNADAHAVYPRSASHFVTASARRASNR